MGNLLDPQQLLGSFGAVGLFVVLFAETGLLVGFFLPGDSLLFSAGILAATPATSAAHLPLTSALVAAAAGALLGAQTGYLIGRRAGPPLLHRPDRPRVRAAALRAQGVLDRYGHRKAIVLARFIPVVRTLMNPLAGAVHVPAGLFSLWQVVGGLVWSVGVILVGYLLGTRIPGIEQYVLPIIAVVVVVSLVPVGLELLKARRRPSER
ncbi:DedA family protein [Quadrisphaera oryzae]|uniref:DedA family protein n=1 Tax=Quadrisphaera TaxID=317661 RepID=UPI001647F047|nr:DedA family protein [Quadrisphaera sp. RL12-1S]